jgi:hypothetical protein
MTAEDANGKRKRTKRPGPRSAAAKRADHTDADSPRRAPDKGSGTGSDRRADNGSSEDSGEDSGQGSGEVPGGGEGELLDLARRVVGLARSEITARHEGHRARTEKARTVLHRAKDGADPDLRPLLDEACQRLDEDEGLASEVVEVKNAVLDDLTHDLAAVAGRLWHAPR